MLLPTGSPTFTINPEVVAVAGAKKGGTRRKTRYVMEMDGQFFFADTIEELRMLFRETKEVAKDVAPKLASKQNIRISPPKIRVSLESGQPIKSKAIRRETEQTQNVVNSIYRKANQDIQQLREIAAKVEAKRKQDEDDIITSLLM